MDIFQDLFLSDTDLVNIENCISFGCIKKKSSVGCNKHKCFIHIYY